jgi:hypothetical protein
MTDLIRATNFVNSMHDPSKPHNLDVIYLSSMTKKNKLFSQIETKLKPHDHRLVVVSTSASRIFATTPSSLLRRFSMP